MNAPRSCIFLGDVAAAIRTLEPVGEDAELIRCLITEMLGFETHQPVSTVMSPSTTPTGPLEPERGHGTAKSQPEIDTAYVQSATAVTRWLPSTIETRKLDDPARDAAVVLSQIPPLPPPRPAALDLAEMALKYPLFEQLWSRAIFTTLIATCRDGGIDLDALVEKVARREHIERLPAKTVPTLRRGAQVLVDTSTGMTAFFADQAWALDEIERVVGRELVQVLSFAGLPCRGVAANIVDEPQPYLAPLPGTPVILLSDLGIARPVGASDRASADEWASFALHVRCAGCPLIALLPYTPARWPRKLRGLVTMIHWDPRTTVGRLRAIIGRVHHVA